MAKRIGRRTFMKGASTAFLGLMAPPLLSSGPSYAQTGKPPALEYRTLGKTGLKVTAVGMGVMNCTDRSVLLRAYDMGVNFYDTARRYMGGRNEELVGRVFQGKRDKILIQTKVRFCIEPEDESRVGRDKSQEPTHRLRRHIVGPLTEVRGRSLQSGDYGFPANDEKRR